MKCRHVLVFFKVLGRHILVVSFIIAVVNIEGNNPDAVLVFLVHLFENIRQEKPTELCLHQVDDRRSVIEDVVESTQVKYIILHFLVLSLICLREHETHVTVGKRDVVVKNHPRLVLVITLDSRGKPIKVVVVILLHVDVSHVLIEIVDYFLIDVINCGLCTLLAHDHLLWLHDEFVAFLVVQQCIATFHLSARHL